jgi:TolB-like protein
LLKNSGYNYPFALLIVIFGFCAVLVSSDVLAKDKKSSIVNNGIQLDDEQRVVKTLAVLPWKLNAEDKFSYLAPALKDMLSTRIGLSGDVMVLSNDEVEKAVAGRAANELTDKAVKKIGKKLKVDYVLYGSLTVIGEAVSLDAGLLNVKTSELTPLFSKGRGIEMVVSVADVVAVRVLEKAAGVKLSTYTAAPTYTGSFKPNEGESALLEDLDADIEEGEFIIKDEDLEKRSFLWKSALMDGHFKSMELADLDGDGTDEVFLLSNTKLVIARLEGRTLKKIKEIKARSDEVNINLSSGDMDGNGTQELYLSKVSQMSGQSVIIEYKNGEYRIVATKLPWFTRVLKPEGEEPVLLGQSFNKKWGFKKKIHVLKRGDKTLEESAVFKAPKKVDLYGFELFDLDSSGTNELVSLVGRKGELRVFKKDEDGDWTLDMTTPNTYGGSLNTIDIGDSASNDFQSDKTGIDYVLIKNRFYFGDFDHDGVKELVIAANVPGGIFGSKAYKVRVFKSGSVVSLEWDGAVFGETWRTRDMKGYIPDFVMSTGAGGGRITMLVVEGAGKVSGKNQIRSYILSYKLQL